MVKYNPTERISLYEAMTHKVFDELRSISVELPNANCIPDLFCFSSKEKQDMGPAMYEKLIPDWYSPILSPGIHVISDAQQEQQRAFK